MDWNIFFKRVSGLLLFVIFAFIFMEKFGEIAALSLVGMFIGILIGLDIDYKSMWKKRG